MGDYYAEGQRVSGEWIGLGAERLGLSGEVRAEEFLRLCDNQHPETGEKLTQRIKTTRRDGEDIAANRRIFYDFTFSPPKSVSLAAFVGGDQRILEAHARAVRSALKEFEAFAAARIRGKGAEGDRMTGNFVGALFTHETSRALDPHLHTHCILFNATFDPKEKRWKALQNCELLQARKFAENAYYHELARDLQSFGYGIRNRPRGDFQLEGVSEELCDRFSKRRAEIDRALSKLLKEKPELAGGDLMTMRRLLATAERARKQRDLSQAELRKLWQSQLTPDERASLETLWGGRRQRASGSNQVSMRESVRWAEEHLFDRNSVVLECQIWQEALGRARGSDFTLGELKSLTQERDYIREASQSGEVTLREVLLREWEIVRTVKDGRAQRHPLVGAIGALNPKLDEEQRIALNTLLTSTDLVSLFRGGAGTGKSYVLRELVERVRQGGKSIVILAPQRQQVVDMEKAGFPSPATVARFLQRREIADGTVVVVDEAGQLSGRQMLELLRLVREHKGRLILSGDTRQHGPVEASDALVAIERYSGVKPVELHRIRRQDPALARDRSEQTEIEGYRAAVEAAANGDLPKSFERLVGIGAVVSCGLGEQADKLADEYVRLRLEGASTVVVSQTWTEVHRVNSRVRESLKSEGLVIGDDTEIQVLDKLDLTNAQKRDARFYPPEAVIVFNEKVRDAEPGAKGKLAGILKSGVIVEFAGRYINVSNRLLDRITICLEREIPVTAGDRLHVKANRKLASGARVTNGELVTVKSVKPDGAVELTDGRTLDTSFREFLPGYAVTSYGSQGKTVDYVLISDSTIKAATNAQQWYVSISRGRRGVRIFTPDKEQLRENIVRSGHRKLALDIAGSARPTPESPLWRRLSDKLLRFGHRVVSNLRRVNFLHPQKQSSTKHHEHQSTRMLGE